MTPAADGVIVEPIEEDDGVPYLPPVDLHPSHQLDY
jgi:hypothetical protein